MDVQVGVIDDVRSATETAEGWRACLDQGEGCRDSGNKRQDEKHYNEKLTADHGGTPCDVTFGQV
jgi:hypothetical protein